MCIINSHTKLDKAKQFTNFHKNKISCYKILLIVNQKYKLKETKLKNTKAVKSKPLKRRLIFNSLQSACLEQQYEKNCRIFHSVNFSSKVYASLKLY